MTPPLASVAFDVGSTLPDSVVSRPDDNVSGSITRKLGLAFEVSSSFEEVGFELSSNVSSPTRAYLYDNDAGSQLDSVDISTLTAGDAFTISAGYQTGVEYLVWIDAEGSNYTFGYYDTPSFPYSSTDVDITAGADEDEADNTRSDNVYNIVSVGNVGF